MRDIQTVIMGNATADPTLVRQEDGTVSAKVRVAVTGRYYNASQQDYADRKTEFITVFVRRQLARNVMLSVRKGQPLIVTGRLHSSEWSGDDGAMRFSLNLQAEALGHDLSFGTAAYRRPDRGEDAPDIDPYTGEAVPSPSAAPAAESTGEDAAEGRDPLTGEERSAEESLAPSF
ncbi:MAG TPA: single-stranded DNA-binding protein [Brachybacterium sp.]|nr:single-stranded DNA-binding protein [Brachybacterium sp.]